MKDTKDYTDDPYIIYVLNIIQVSASEVKKCNSKICKKKIIWKSLLNIFYSKNNSRWTGDTVKDIE